MAAYSMIMNENAPSESVFPNFVKKTGQDASIGTQNHDRAANDD